MNNVIKLDDYRKTRLVRPKGKTCKVASIKRGKPKAVVSEMQRVRAKLIAPLKEKEEETAQLILENNHGFEALRTKIKLVRKEFARVNPEKLHQHIEKVRNITSLHIIFNLISADPKAIEGYPTFFYALVEELLSRDLDLKNVL